MGNNHGKKLEHKVGAVQQVQAESVAAILSLIGGGKGGGRRNGVVCLLRGKIVEAVGAGTVPCLIPIVPDNSNEDLAPKQAAYVQNSVMKWLGKQWNGKYIARYITPKKSFLVCNKSFAGL